MKIKVNVNNASELVSSHSTQSGAGAKGQALRLKAQKAVKYELVNEDTGFAPENIATKRVGQDLHVAFEKSAIDTPDLVIEGYYDAREWSPEEDARTILAAAIETAFGASVREIEPVWRDHVETIAQGSATGSFERLTEPSPL